MKTNNKTNNGVERVVKMFAERMAERMETMQAQGKEWQKNWLCTTASNMMPQNVQGREYTAMNAFILMMLAQLNEWQMPVYMTLNKCNELGAKVIKGAEATPVLFWRVYAKNVNTGATIKVEDYNQLSKDERKNWKQSATLRYYNVFNVAQTTIKEDAPKEYEKLMKRANVVEQMNTDTDGMYCNAELDDMMQSQSWVCPIRTKEQDRAFYSQTTDTITLPCKYQFTGATRYDAGIEYYSTMLHEMAHSTGAETRLNRLQHTTFGSEVYAKEELVAELTAALVGYRLGIATTINDNNACYLASWAKVLKEEPRFIISVLADVQKAQDMILAHLKRA